MNIVESLKPKTATEKRTHTVVDTIVITPGLLAKWLSPPFQRPVRENEKVRALAEHLKQNGGVLPGIITLGVLDGDVYIIDGQHRKAAFILSGLAEGYTDIRKHFFADMADMGDEFVTLNSQLVRMRPDDILRGLEASVPQLGQIREQCPFVGYDMIRHNETKAPMVSMSALLRQWQSSGQETPSHNGCGLSTAGMAKALAEDDVRHITGFLKIAIEAFGRDQESFRLWSGLNMVMCMWAYRNMVLRQYSPKVPRLDRDLFKKCLMSLSADANYVDWLLGRKLGERDRSPCYTRMKLIFAKRLGVELGKKVMMPQPVWQHGTGHPERHKG